MGIYARYLLPRIIDFAMKNAESARLRAVWVPRARGDVLEVGIGSGLNLPFYSAEVRHVYGVDPSLELQQMARRRVGSLAVQFLAQSAEQPLPLADASVDTVLVTWSLCSIPHPARALAEMRRVLKPGGRFIFIEHGHSPDERVAAWQDRLTPIWKHATGGCHLNRQIDDLITVAGFRIAKLETGYLPGPRPMTFTYRGVARPA